MRTDYQQERFNTMQRAGRAITALVKSLLDGDLVDRSVVMVVGQSESSYAGLVAAQMLLEAGAWLQIVCAAPTESYSGELAAQLHSLQEAGAPLAWAEDGWELPPCDLLIDALLGSGQQQPPSAKVREIILLANSNAAPILSIDAPAGVNDADGTCFSPHITAVATLLLNSPKPGLLQASLRPVCGTLYQLQPADSSSTNADADLPLPLTTNGQNT